MTRGEESSKGYVARLFARWDDVSDCYALHCGWCCGGVVGLQLKQLLGIRTVALTFRREALSVLDFVLSWRQLPFLPNVGVRSQGPCSTNSWWRPSSVLCSQLTYGLLHTSLCLQRTHHCSSTVSFDQWTKLHDLSEDRGESVRLDWGSRPPVDSDLRESRLPHS